jgi:hypothetical protein
MEKNVLRKGVLNNKNACRQRAVPGKDADREVAASPSTSAAPPLPSPVEPSPEQREGWRGCSPGDAADPTCPVRLEEARPKGDGRTRRCRRGAGAAGSEEGDGTGCHRWWCCWLVATVAGTGAIMAGAPSKWCGAIVDGALLAVLVRAGASITSW